MFFLRLFGEVAIEGERGRVTGRPVQRHRLALLALLAADRSGGMSRDRLVAYLWPESDTERARHLLSHSVYVLRQALGEEAILSGSDGLRLNPGILRTDVGSFEEALAEGRAEDAAALYRGPFLEGFFVGDSPEFERWVDAARERLARGYARALETIAESREREGDFSGAVQWWRRLASEDGYSSRIALRLMRALERSGDPGGALQHARVHAALLREELGIEPDEEVTTLAERLRSRPVRGRPPTEAARTAPEDPDGESSRSNPASSPPPSASLRDSSAPPHRRRRTAARVLTGAALSLLLIAGSTWLGRSAGGPGPRGASIRSLAVLPLENLSGDSEQEYFADGMTDALITELARHERLRVISRTSSMRYKGARRPLPEIARELGVDAVVAGTVLRDGERIRITAQLIHGATDEHLWAESYERNIREVLTLQAAVADVVAQEIGIALRTAQSPAARPRPAVEPKAYEAYLKGRYYWAKRDAADLERALDSFREALDLDPTFAPAYAGLGDSYAMLGAPAFGYRPPEEMFVRARAAARQALQLDSTLAEAHATLGFSAMNFDWDWQAAEREFRRAIALNPGYASTHQWYSLLLVSLGRADAALREAQRARELDPLGFSITGTAARIAYYARRYDQALRHFRSAQELSSANPWPRVGMAMVHAAQQQYGPALAHLDSVSESFGGLTEGVRGYVYASSGRSGEARRIVAELTRRPPSEYVSPVYIAMVHGALGENDRAFAWLDRAHEERAGMLRFVKMDPLFDPLRRDPRFPTLLARMGLE